MSKKKFYWLILVAAVLLLPGCLKGGRYKDRAENSCRIVVKADNPRCENIQIRQASRSADFAYTILFDACGTLQAYEWGKWCEDCSRRCRRSK